jgi:hypothetical protein
MGQDKLHHKHSHKENQKIKAVEEHLNESEILQDYVRTTEVEMQRRLSYRESSVRSDD